MNDPKSNADQPLIEEATREAWRQSVFWRGDHPPENSLGYQAPPMPTTNAELLAGAKTALAQAMAMFGVARERLSEEGHVAGAAADRARHEIRPFMVNAMLGVIRADVQRARGDVRHWKEYVTYYEGQTGPSVKLNRNAFTPSWHGEKLSTEGEDKF